MNNNDVLFSDLRVLGHDLNSLGLVPHGPMIYSYFLRYSDLITQFYIKHYTNIKSSRDNNMQMLTEHLYNFVTKCSVSRKQVILYPGSELKHINFNRTPAPRLTPSIENELYYLTNPYVILHLIAKILENTKK